MVLGVISLDWGSAWRADMMGIAAVVVRGGSKRWIFEDENRFSCGGGMCAAHLCVQRRLIFLWFPLEFSPVSNVRKHDSNLISTPTATGKVSLA
jgi:hypothetical protein